MLKGASKTQYWIYDREAQTDNLIFEHPAWGGGVPSFSPDSRYLVISAGYDNRWTDASASGIYLFDTATMRVATIVLPELKKNRTAHVSADWSQDGKAVLILMRNASAKEGFDYFSYTLATKKIETLSGRYNRKLIRHEFHKGSHGISAWKDVVLPSDSGSRSAWSPGRKWHARIDERQGGLSYELAISDDEGVSKSVELSRYSQCEGRALSISGWLDKRHLVYRKSTSYFVVDAETGAIAVLFNEMDMARMFTW